MSEMNETQVIIAGRVLTLTGYETAEYTQKVGNYINKKLDECKTDPGFRNQNKETQMLMLAINVTDDYMKIVEKLAENEQLIKDKDKEIYNLKHDIISTQQRLDKADDMVRTLQDKIAESSKKLLQLDAKLGGKSRKKASETETRSSDSKSSEVSKAGHPAKAADEVKEPEPAKEVPKAPETPKASDSVKAPEAPKTTEASKVPEPPKTAEASKAPELPKAAEASKAPEPPKTAEASKVPEPPKASEASKVPEPPKAADTPKAPEAPKAHDDKKDSDNKSSASSFHDNSVGFRPGTMPRLVKDDRDENKDSTDHKKH